MKDVKKVAEAQNQCIRRLQSYIKSFVSNGSDSITRVMSVSIPTGWGKTRIAIQSILHSANEKATIVLWPQRKDHAEEIWQRPRDWKEKDNSISCSIPNWLPIDEKEERNTFSYFEYKGKDWIQKQSTRKTNFIKQNEKKTFFFIFARKKTSKANVQRRTAKIQNKQSPIFFIIDEWHARDFLKDFEKYCTDRKDVFSDYDEVAKAESFWREKLLGCNTKRKLFVMLLSATPLASTSRMDLLHEKATEKEIEQQNQADESAFETLTDVGNQNRDKDNPYAIYEIYPDVLEHKMDFLKNERSLADKKIEKFKKEKLCNWSKDYLRILKNISFTIDKKGKNIYGNVIYLNEQRAILDLGAKKFRVLCELLRQYEKKFLIFCTYREVARKLEAALKNVMKKDSIRYLNNCPRQSTLADFNKPEGKIRYLIATDKDSQGIDLQNSGAWLIHYELPWNPIRVIQRFGRVWRFNQNGDGSDETELTCPVAFRIPSTYSAEEEKINRLERRWDVLSKILTQKSAKHLRPVDFEIAMGLRVTPKPYKD